MVEKRRKIREKREEIPRKLRIIKRRVKGLLLLVLVLGAVQMMGRITYYNQAYGDSNRYLLNSKSKDKNAIIYSMENEIEKIDTMKEEETVKTKKKELQKEKDVNRKIAYLTFDDGPTTNITPQVLNILDKYDIKATFFVVGKLVDANPGIVKDIYNRGHKLGNHSYTHNYKSMYQSYDKFYNDIAMGNTALKRALGEDYRTNLIRFPGGCFGKVKESYAKRIEKEGYTSYNWNALSGDSEGLNKSVNYLRQRFQYTVGNQKELIILMHDAKDKQNTVAFLPEAIEYLLDRGYEFRVLD